jgi:hypothetical protein
MPLRASQRARLARVVVAAEKRPDSDREPETPEEKLHFIPVPQSVVLAIVRTFARLLDCIQRL